MSLKLRFSINKNFCMYVHKKFLPIYFKYINLIRDNMRIYKYKYMKFCKCFFGVQMGKLFSAKISLSYIL